MIYWMSFIMILNGVCGDLVNSCLIMPDETWQYWYSLSRDIQFIGFALLAFAICDYEKLEIKVATFFLVIWRSFVTIINLFELPIFLSPISVILFTCIYLTWLGKTAKMGTISGQEEKAGAYYFLMPIHSFWGLLKSVFLPWEMARYESVVVIDGGTLWAVNNGRFVKRETKFTNIEVRTGAKVYLGRSFCGYEIAKLDSFVGKRCIPGIRDCRKLRIV